jgi:hypothetical protein
MHVNHEVPKFIFNMARNFGHACVADTSQLVADDTKAWCCIEFRDYLPISDVRTNNRNFPMQSRFGIHNTLYIEYIKVLKELYSKNVTIPEEELNKISGHST